MQNVIAEVVNGELVIRVKVDEQTTPSKNGKRVLGTSNGFQKILERYAINLVVCKNY